MSCQRCPSTLGVSTGPRIDELGYERLCWECLRDIVPERWEVKARV